MIGAKAIYQKNCVIIGIYPTLETLLAQSILLLALVVALLWLWRGTQTSETYGKAEG
jgi:high-affinity Fe2+/Pb2+ permease